MEVKSERRLLIDISEAQIVQSFLEDNIILSGHPSANFYDQHILEINYNK
jgi:hypothetical protein